MLEGDGAGFFFSGTIASVIGVLSWTMEGDYDIK
jgi:hypothetical protein